MLRRRGAIYMPLPLEENDSDDDMVNIFGTFLFNIQNISRVVIE
jgi:hypothetical protein